MIYENSQPIDMGRKTGLLDDLNPTPKKYTGRRNITAGPYLVRQDKYTGKHQLLLDGRIVCDESHPNFQAIVDELIQPIDDCKVIDAKEEHGDQEKLDIAWRNLAELDASAVMVSDSETFYQYSRQAGYFSDFSDDYIGSKSHAPLLSRIAGRF